MTMTVAVALRDDTMTLDTLRTNGSVPAVIYGPKQAPVKISVEAKTFEKVLKEAGESTILELTGLTAPIEVLIKDVDFNQIKQSVNHVDFYAVEKGKAVTTHVPLHFIGEAPVEASRTGVVTKVLHEIEITCQTADLPSHIDVDLSVLQTLEDKIHVSDLAVPAKVTIETGADESVVVVGASRVSSEPETSEAEPIDMDAIEVEEKGKTDEE